MKDISGFRFASPNFSVKQNIDLDNDFAEDGKIHIYAPYLFLTCAQDTDVDFTQIWSEGIQESVGGVSDTVLFNESSYNITFKLMGVMQFTIPAGTRLGVWTIFEDGNPLPTFRTYQL